MSKLQDYILKAAEINIISFYFLSDSVCSMKQAGENSFGHLAFARHCRS